MIFSRTSLRRAGALASLLLGALVVGCDDTGPPDAEAPDTFPSFEAFRAEIHPDSEGRFVVDSDIAIHSEQGLREFYAEALGAHQDELAAEEGVGAARDRLIVNTSVGKDDLYALPGRYDLTYCVSSSFGSHFNTVVTELEAATRSWADRIGVRYRFVSAAPCNTSTSVDFNVRPAPSGAGYFASSFFPGTSRGARELLIGDTAFTTKSGGRDFQGILRHEIGHTLGFRHEHILLKGECTSEGKKHTREVTEYDPDSIMHYPQCRPDHKGGYRQSYLDVRGGNLLYGLAPALTSSAAL